MIVKYEVERLNKEFALINQLLKVKIRRVTDNKILNEFDLNYDFCEKFNIKMTDY